MRYDQRMTTTQQPNETREHALLCGMLLVQLGREVGRRFTDALKPSELTPRQLHVLDELRQSPMSQQALANRVSMDPTKLVGLLNDLESRQLISRRRDPLDRRRHIVESTQEGEGRVAAAFSAAAAAEAEIMGGLDTEQRSQLKELLILAAESSGIVDTCVDPSVDATDRDDCLEDV